MWFIVFYRIININQEKISTKGDANRTSDPEIITQNMVIGKVIFVIPKLGYLVSFSKTIPGVIFLIIIPCSILIGDEILKIFQNYKKHGVK